MDSIPNKIIREIVSGIIADRGNRITNNYFRLEEEKNGVDEETAKKIGIDAQINSMLASRVLEGSVPIKEIIDTVLTPDEIKLARIRCDQWLDNKKESEMIQ